MMTNSGTATALVGGYLLGRTKKAKVAIGLGMFLAGKKLSPDPRQLGRLVAGSPLLSGLTDQVRTELFEATKAAAGSALTSRMNRLSESLGERVRGLDAPPTDEAAHDGTAHAEAHSDGPGQDEPRERRPRSRPRTTAARTSDAVTTATGPAERRTPTTRGNDDGSRTSGPRGRGAAPKTQAEAGPTGKKAATAKAPRSARKNQEDDRG
ncbi:hypothetical protein [Streptomyces sp. HB132]|uniref:hypothetical protein n=1 Tax=Streptomyces sp. HB132 TaxID=767388 RepID=UPI001D1CCC3D|nr:hypothetical protein [Streptomyces sp. HB132]MBM7440180.1 hypothetical protein [Streptomyces sp. HB132]